MRHTNKKYKRVDVHGTCAPKNSFATILSVASLPDPNRGSWTSLGNFRPPDPLKAGPSATKQEVKVIWQKAPHGGPFPG